MSVKSIIKEFPCTFSIKVTPKASKNSIKIEYDASGQICLIRVYVTVAPEDGKANQAVVDLLAKELGISKRLISIRQGLKSRNKVIEIYSSSSSSS